MANYNLSKFVCFMLPVVKSQAYVEANDLLNLKDALSNDEYTGIQVKNIKIDPLLRYLLEGILVSTIQYERDFGKYLKAKNLTDEKIKQDVKDLLNSF